MKSYAIIVLLFLLLMTAGCQQISEGGTHSAKNGFHVIFLYDQTTDNSATDDYLDALLHTVNHCPLKPRQITIQTGKEEDLIKKYELNQTPALIVKKGDLTEMRLEGNNNRDIISKKLLRVIQHKNSD